METKNLAPVVPTTLPRDAGLAAAGVVVGFLLGTISLPLPVLAPSAATAVQAGNVWAPVTAPAMLSAPATDDRQAGAPTQRPSLGLDPAPSAASQGLEPCWAVVSEAVRC